MNVINTAWKRKLYIWYRKIEKWSYLFSHNFKCILYSVVNLLRKTLWSRNEDKEDAAETKPNATLEAAVNNSATSLVDRYCFLQGNQFCGAGDTVRVLDIVPALEAGQEVTESETLLRIVDALF